jgi:HNH endonuclease
MGKWVHRIDAVDMQTGFVKCEACGWVKGDRSDHNRFGYRCSNGRGTKRRGRSTKDTLGYWRRLKLKQDHCESPTCTATIEDMCQLELDHIDGDYSNNDSSNIQTLCCNCHRLKTKQEKRSRNAKK